MDLDEAIEQYAEMLLLGSLALLRLGERKMPTSRYSELTAIIEEIQTQGQKLRSLHTDAIAKKSSHA